MSTPASQKTAKIVAIANQKGGVGKTTTTINLGAALAEKGLMVIIVDLDPQGNASTGLGIMERPLTVYDLLLGETTLKDAVKETAFTRIALVPANIDLSSADIEFGTNKHRSHLLRKALRNPDLATLNADIVLIDCPPSLNLLTVNAFIASDSVLVPLQSEFFALEGLSQLMLTIREVRQSANPDLRVEGIVLTMYDTRNNLSQQVEEDARANLGDLIFKTRIPRNVRLSEAPSYAIPVLEYDSDSKGANAYRSLADEVISKNQFQIETST